MAPATFETDLAVGFTGTLNEILEKMEVLSTKDVHTAILVCNFIHNLFKDARRGIENGLRQGVEARSFATTYERAVAELDRVRGAVARVLEKARTSHLPTLGEEFISSYEDLTADLDRLRQFLAEAVIKAKAPPRPIDWDRVREADAAYARGETMPFLKSSPSRNID
ncbi:MAG TPA: hypothetical protein VN688_30205 [Gemmataceae bacterium]|nr:hypothetical protein [Gemmataceae bacterium]